MGKQPIRRFEEAIRKASAKGQWPRVVALLQELVAAEPDNPRWRLRLAESLVRAGRGKDATEAYVAAFRRFVELDDAAKARAVIASVRRLDPDVGRRLEAQLGSGKSAPGPSGRGEGAANPARPLVTPPPDASPMPDRVKAMLDRAATALPEFPGLVYELSRELQRPTCEVKDVVRIVSVDPLIASRLLQIVNSPYYQVPNPITDLHRSVLLLGYSHVYTLVVQQKLAPPFSRHLRASRALLSRFWHRSHLVSTGASFLARETGLAEAGLATTLAVLQDVGKLAFFFLDEQKAQAELFPEGSLEEALAREVEVFGAGHPEVGAYIAGLWHLPEELATLIRHHHAPFLLPLEEVPEPLRGVLLIVALAEVLTTRHDPSSHSTSGPGTLREEYLTPVGGASALDNLLTPRLRKELETARGVFDMVAG